MIFRYATLIFLTPDLIFGDPDPRSGSWTGWGPLGAKKGGPKNITLWRDWSPIRFPRIFEEGNGFYPTQVYQFPPKPSQGELFTGISPEPENSRGPPGPLGGLPIVPLWARGLLQGSVAWPQAFSITLWQPLGPRGNRFDSEATTKPPGQPQSPRDNLSLIHI